ncbi:hypothetical protein Q4I32_005597 [Leishmania shawi]|uniref:Uncharacterized protein n=1 Tax=Leishmania shawi TaxID=5680 RepID=A0AAW3BIZ4_9TRYP
MDKEYEQCMCHYATSLFSRTWIAASDTEPALVWSKREETACKSRKPTSSPKPPRTSNSSKLDDKAPALPLSNTRYRNQFLKLTPAPISTAAAHEAMGCGAAVSVLISEEEDGQGDSSRNTPPSSPQQEGVMHISSKRTCDILVCLLAAEAQRSAVALHSGPLNARARAVG